MEDTIIPSNTLDRRAAGSILEAETDRLAQFIEERFPEEAATINLSNRKEILQLVTELLERLWRWEH